MTHFIFHAKSESPCRNSIKPFHLSPEAIYFFYLFIRLSTVYQSANLRFSGSIIVLLYDRKLASSLSSHLVIVSALNLLKGVCLAYLPEVFSAELLISVRHKLGNDIARLLWWQEKPLLVLIDEDGMEIGSHAGLAFLPDLLLHIRVHLTR